MIRFFRKTRLKLFSENKLRKYLLYAVGEILITVIGILIAIQINNLNQQRLAKIKINRFLLEIKSNLPNEIELAENGIEFYNYKDTLLTRVKARTITKEEFNANPDYRIQNQSPQYAAASGYYAELSVNKNAYKSLVQISDRIPNKYHSLYLNLKFLYEDANNLVNEREDKLLEKYYRLNFYMIENKPFWADLWQELPLNDAAVDYFMHDPIYLNWVYEIHDDFLQHQRSLKVFKKVAEEVNKQLSELKL